MYAQVHTKSSEVKVMYIHNKIRYCIDMIHTLTNSCTHTCTKRLKKCYMAKIFMEASHWFEFIFRLIISHYFTKTTLVDVDLFAIRTHQNKKNTQRQHTRFMSSSPVQAQEQSQQLSAQVWQQQESSCGRRKFHQEVFACFRQAAGTFPDYLTCWHYQPEVAVQRCQNIR